MNWLDALFVLIVVYSLARGIARGIARELLGLGALVLGLLCGFWFYPVAGAYLGSWIHSHAVANLAGFLLIFFACLLLGGLAGTLIAKLLRLVKLSWLDRLLGAAFGVVRGVLLCAVLVLVALGFAAKGPPRAVVNSLLAPYVVDAARWMVAAAPHDLKNAFEETYEKTRRIWETTLKKGLHRPRTEKD